MGGQGINKDRRFLLSMVTLAVAMLVVFAVAPWHVVRAAGAPRSSNSSEWAETSIWASNALPEVVDSGDAAATEVGVKFRSHVSGFVTGIRFYKSEANTGSHVGTLWTEAGKKLATATFKDETAEGWQQVTFPRRVAIQADSTYVASYHTNTGHYAADPLYFVAERDNGTLELLRNTAERGNGVYEQGAQSTFPGKTQKGTNYWVDVTFVPAHVAKGDTYLPWEGGSAYYKQWPNGPSPTGDPHYFPLGVWMQDPANAEAYKALGINLYVAGSRRSSPDLLEAAGMGYFFLGVHKRIADPEQRAELLAKWGKITVAWGQIDEPDNGQELPGGKIGPCVPPPEVIDVYKMYRESEPTRPVYLGVGKSVDDFVQSHYHHPLRASCDGHYEDYPEYLKGSDIISYDSYPINVHKPLWYVAKGMDELRAWSDYRKPVYEAVETTAIRNTAGKPTPEQVKSETWMLIIHGGMGVIWFCHILSPPVDAAGMLHDPAMAAMVGVLDHQIIALAPVLNTQSVANGVHVSSQNGKTPVDTMLKRSEGKTYLFAEAARPGGATTATFTLRGCPAHATATVLGENRQVEITNGAFQDNFANDYEVHIYQIGFDPAGAGASAAQ